MRYLLTSKQGLINLQKFVKTRIKAVLMSEANVKKKIDRVRVREGERYIENRYVK